MCLNQLITSFLNIVMEVVVSLCSQRKIKTIKINQEKYSTTNRKILKVKKRKRAKTMEGHPYSQGTYLVIKLCIVQERKKYNMNSQYKKNNQVKVLVALVY
jgi:hypothetical protein